MGNQDGIDRSALPAELAQFAQSAAAMERIAVVGLKVDPTALNAREKEFANALLRHAKGVKTAIAAWQTELAGQS